MALPRQFSRTMLWLLVMVFLSVAQPSPVMRAYIAVRKECEERVRAAGIPATFLRPFYVLGEGHWWPLALVPFYKLAEAAPGWRESAIRLGLLKRRQMVNALVWAVENPGGGRAGYGRGADPGVLDHHSRETV